MNNIKKIVVLRHGQAKNAGVHESDSARALTAQGSKDAEHAGQYLSAAGFVPDLVLCSPTIRTRETLSAMRLLFPDSLQVEYVPQIYHATEHELLNIIENVAKQVKNLLIIGHNPAMHQLAIFLANNSSEENAEDAANIDRLYMQFPPCAMAGFSVYGNWREIENAKTKLEFFLTPEG